MTESPESLSLKIAQVSGILEQYRVNIYNLELRLSLLVKMIEEKSIFAIEEFERRWPLYLKNTVGILGSDGIMEGSLKVHFFGENR